MNMTTELAVSHQLNEDFKRLIWDVFFESRGRGVSFYRHFPWCERPSDEVFYITLTENNAITGGLVVKKTLTPVEGKIARIGLIGLVCVRPDRRGQGNSRKIIEYAIASAHRWALDALTLWTSKPEVYAPHGFVGKDDSAYGTITFRCAGPATTSIHIQTNELPSDIGLPPFSNKGKILTSDRAEIIVVETDTEKTVAKWSGEPSDVAELIRHAIPGPFRINIDTNDRLIAALTSGDTEIRLQKNNLQMWKALNPSFQITSLAKITKFSVLDRI